MDSTGSTGRKTAAESHISFSSPRGSYASFVYSATGERLKATHYTSPRFHGGVAEVSYLTDSGSDASPAGIDPGLLEIAGLTKLEYHGPVVYRNGKVDMVRFPGGYATIKDGAVTFHYYTQDYLGSNRAVVNGSTGAIEQTVAYYPYGSVIADLGTGSDRQPFKFGGKELTLQNGLNEYDFGARQYYPAVPHFTTVDPLCEKYYWLSPYLYCANNPVNIVDPTGMYMKMPPGSTQKQIQVVLSNLQKLTDDKIKYSPQPDGSVRFKIVKLTPKGNKPAGTRLVRRLNRSSKKILISVNTSKGNREHDEVSKHASNGVGTNSIIIFNPTSNPNILVADKNGKITVQKRPNQIGLAHELIHAERSSRGDAIDKSKKGYNVIYKEGRRIIESLPLEEAATIGLNNTNKNDITENEIREEQGELKRAAYGN